MEIIELSIPGVFGIRLNKMSDIRGTFTRLWNSVDFQMDFNNSQTSIATNSAQFTLRGMHYQIGEESEQKLIYCISGKAYDVAIDLRKDSSQYRNWIGIEIGNESEYQGVYITKGFAHGYLTLENDTNMLYCIDKPYSQKSSRGLMWNDPQISIKWPESPRVMSDQDSNWKRLQP